MTSLLLAAALFAAFPQAADVSEPGRRDELARMVDAYLISNLQEHLDLGDEQFVKLLPRVKRLQDDRRAFAERRGRILLEMRASLRSGTATEGRLEQLLDDLRRIERDEPKQISQDREAVDKVLTTAQQAKYRILEVEVERRLRELVERVRDDRGRRPPQREP